MNTETEQLSAADWIARLSDTQELTHAEKTALAEFLRESPTNIRELIQQTFIRHDLNALQIPQQQLDAWVAEVRASSHAIPFPEQRSGPIPWPRSGFPTKALRRRLAKIVDRRFMIAAAVTAVLAIGGLLVHARVGLYTTGFGEQRILTLADGSVVSLNTESQMKVRFTDDARSIALIKGEAFFNVAHDAARPFLVSIDNAVVRAIGTQFNVRRTPQDAVVSMLDGVVRVSLDQDASSLSAAIQQPDASGSMGAAKDRQAPPRQITLSKGEAARIDRSDAGGDVNAALAKLDTPAALRAASWIQGRLEFDAMPLAEVLTELQRYRRFDVQIDNDATRQLKLTGSFGSHDFESVLAYIATIPGMTVEQTGPHSFFIGRS